MLSACLFLGSPRKGGNSETLARAYLEPLRKKGGTIHEFHLPSMSLKDCVDCRRCWTTGKPCVIDDDMSGIYEAIKETELLVFATPLYWYAWPAAIQAVRDRLLPYRSDKAPFSLKGRKAVLIASGGDSGQEVFQGLRFSFEHSSALHGMEILDLLCEPGLHNVDDAKKNEELLEKMRQAGEKLAI